MSSVSSGEKIQFSQGLVRAVIGAIGLALFGIYFFEAQKMPLGDDLIPGPGIFPMIVAVMGMVVSALVVVDAFTKRELEQRIELPGKPVLTKVALFALVIVLYVVLLPILGQYIAASLFCVASVKIIGNVSWIKSVVAGLLIAVPASWLFIETFQIPLPSGELF